MSVSIGTGKVRATIQIQGAMTTALFEAGTDKEFTPSYVATWEGFPEAPILDKLRGDFLCVPFGAAPETAEELPEGWRNGHNGASPWIHGPSANLRWNVEALEADSAVLSLDYADDDPVKRVERRVTCVEGAVEFEDSIIMRVDARLPLGLHPIFRLPENPGDAHIELGEADGFWAFPADSGTTVLERGARFSDLAKAPRADGGTIDLTRLPLTEEVDEIVLTAGPKDGRVTVVNDAEGYKATLEWDRTLLNNVMFWISNHGRKGAPWGGTNLCLGVEPITSAFDFGEGVSAATNPLTEAGYATAIDLKAGQTYTITHRISAERI